MDLSFSRMLERTAADGTAFVPADLTIVLAALLAWQARGPTARAFANILRGQEHGDSRIDALAGIFAPRDACKWDVSCLAGSFNPLIARTLTVGQDK
jgi:hypothetical protein